MNQNSDEQPERETGSSSVRVAILFFLGTLVLLFVMGVIWLFIRVDVGPTATRVECGTIVDVRNLPLRFSVLG